MPGTYEWEEKGLTFTVETTYPYSDKVKIKVSGTRQHKYQPTRSVMA